MPEIIPTSQNVFNLLGQGFSHHQQNRLEEAEGFYRKALSFEPNNFDALQLLGVLLAATGNYLEATKLLNHAVTVNNNDPIVFNNLGVALKELSQKDLALENYNRAIELNPAYAEAYLNRANVFKDDGQHREALDDCSKAIIFKPEYAEAHYCRGVLLQQLEDWNAALENYNVALQLDPNYADAYLNRGVIFHNLKKLDDALVDYNQAIQLDPNYADAHYNRGCLLRDLASPIEAKISLSRALELQPNHAFARWALALLPIPLLRRDDDNIDAAREELFTELVSLDLWFDASKIDNAHSTVGISQPFYLAYQEFNNKELLNLYGSICTKLMGKYEKQSQLTPTQLTTSKKIRIGIVSHHIHTHSVWDAFTKGLLLNIDSARFEVFIFYVGNYFDDETRLAKSSATFFISGVKSVDEYSKEIIKQGIEVLIYPEIGMHAITTQLASLRLSPLQIASWGHPETTGLSTIDYYLSGDLFEPHDAQLAYSEKLLRLPNLGCNSSERLIKPADIDIQKLGLTSEKPILLCPGNLFKYTPEYDWVFAEIANRLSECQLVFFSKNDHWLSIFKNRLAVQFKKRNLQIDDYVIFIPWLKPSDFYGLMGCANVFLDTIGFSGFNTALQSIECSLPIVTRKSQFMRGNLAGGILKRMRMFELIANDEDQYINLAIRLVEDKEFSSLIRKNITQRRSILFNDPEPISALENFLEASCRA
jgi:predicted O-linked N-acetylglucosamine transferase (SPINDLY family)